MRLTFGKLTLALPHDVRNGRVYVLCHCTCGNDVFVREDKLEERRSCGCAAVPRQRVATKRASTPKRAPGRKPFVTPELRSTYSCWKSMRWRCHGKSNGRAQKAYRDAGITVCERWRASFADFVADVGVRPTPAHSLDRYPDNAGNYEPGNVRWATAKEQANNMRPRRCKVLLEYRGERLDIRELVARTGLTRATVRGRIDAGWTAERILSTPLVPVGQRHLLPVAVRRRPRKKAA